MVENKMEINEVLFQAFKEQELVSALNTRSTFHHLHISMSIYIYTHCY